MARGPLYIQAVPSPVKCNRALLRLIQRPAHNASDEGLCPLARYSYCLNLVYISAALLKKLASFFTHVFEPPTYNSIDLCLLRSLQCAGRHILHYRKEIHMPSDRRRILELALESLQEKKKRLDEEIAEITRELRGGVAAKAVAAARKRSRFSKEERLRRSQRMKAYWDNWRKKKSQKK